jgi:hypothetical protein
MNFDKLVANDLGVQVSQSQETANRPQLALANTCTTSTRPKHAFKSIGTGSAAV